MKRSEVNAILEEALAYFAAKKFYLPPFARWSPQEWQTRGPEAAEIVERSLGWDLTDYGMGEYKKYGLLLFTLRNGWTKPDQFGRQKPYAEKIMVAEPGQQHQMHFHARKVEDIINRAGGRLVIQLYNATPDDKLDDTPVEISQDGVARSLPAGSVISLQPGESITLWQRMFHQFWAEGERVMIGEVSSVNDDTIDNFFYNLVGEGRFGSIEEDTRPRYLLSTDYRRYWRPVNGATSAVGSQMRNLTED